MSVMVEDSTRMQNGGVELAPTAPVVLPIHNPNGRSCAMLL